MRGHRIRRIAPVAQPDPAWAAQVRQTGYWFAREAPGWQPPADLLESLGASVSVFCAGSLPHGWLFGQVAAVVHHGGFGTTAAGLRSGVPSIAIPHIIDQFACGKTVHELGVGPAPIPRTKLSAAALAQVEATRTES